MPAEGRRHRAAVPPAAAESRPLTDMRNLLKSTAKSVAANPLVTLLGVLALAFGSYAGVAATRATSSATGIGKGGTPPGHGGTAPGQEAKQFTVSGNLPHALSPGRSATLNLTLTNPNNWDLLVDSFSVQVSSTGAAGCSPTTNFQATQLHSSAYPLRLPPGSHTLTQLGVSDAHKPKVAMLDLPTVNQNACKNTTVGLTYSGTAAK